MLIVIKEKSKLAFLILFILLVSLIMAGCDNGGSDIETLETYNALVTIEGVIDEDHAEVFSVSSNENSSVDQFNYEDNKLTGEITDLSESTELTLLINNDILTNGKYLSEIKVIEVKPNNTEPNFKVEFIEDSIYTVTGNYENGIIEGYGEYAEGEIVELTASPDEGYDFIEWTGYVTDTANPITFDMPAADVELNAVFREENSDFAGGTGTETNPYQVANADQLNKIRNYLDSHFKQIDDIDLAEYSNWNPIGDENNPFLGSYDGAEYNINNLIINRESEDYVGLFGYIKNAQIKNTKLRNIEVSGYNYVGGLVGYADNEGVGELINNSIEGSVESNYYTGGLVGYNSYGSITESYATGNVSGDRDTGGLIGQNSDGDITESYATGDVNGSSSTGGLIGNNYGDITESYATGNVSGDRDTGGLIGQNSDGDITESYATGGVNGKGNTGGLLGLNNFRGSITKSYAEGYVTTGDVSGDIYTGIYTGGLVGKNSGEIIESYATGDVSGSSARADASNESSTGGLIGNNYGDITESYATGSVSGSSNTGGLLGRNAGGIVIIDSYATGNVSGGYHAGGLIGYNSGYNGARITKNYATGNVSGNYYIGGLIGLNNVGDITESYAIGNISGENFTGGLIGHISNGDIINNYAFGNVIGENFTGGLLGQNSNGDIINNYAYGKVEGNSDVGGFVGSNESRITHGYAAGKVTGNVDVGGFAGVNGGTDGFNEGTIGYSYYDKDTTGQSDEGNGIPKPTEEMIQQDTFLPEWDFNDIWEIDEGTSYPYLQWQDNNTPIPQ